jgi:hypothetical protein
MYDKFCRKVYKILSRVGWVTWLIIRKMLVYRFVSFGPTLAELQVFTSQLITHELVTCLLLIKSALLVVSWRELNCRELELNCLQLPFYNLAANSTVNTLLNSSSLRCRGIVLPELLHSNWLSRLCWLPRIFVMEPLPGNGCSAFIRCLGFGCYRSVD